MKVYHTDPKLEYYTDEGCDIIEILNDTHHQDISLARAKIAPGITTQLHSLSGTEEIYYILEGHGRVFIVNEWHTLVQGDCVVIPSDQSQCIENTGKTDLKFLCICRPAFLMKNYKEIHV